MKYRQNHPSQDLALALGLEKSQQTRIEHAIMKAFDEAQGNAEGVNMDEMVAIAAPYIKTTEEGFYAAMTMFANIEAAKNNYYAPRN